jgi:hypothetical protein
MSPVDSGHDQDADAATVDDDQQPDAGDEDQPDAADEDQPDAADEDQPDAADEDQPDAGDPGGPDAGDPGLPDGTANDAEDAGDDQPTLSVSLPQSVADALLANPDVYDQIPLRIAVNGQADDVSALLDQQTYPATDADSDGVWTANIMISGLADGEYTLVAQASYQGGTAATASADLVISRTGVLHDLDRYLAGRSHCLAAGDRRRRPLDR